MAEDFLCRPYSMEPEQTAMDREKKAAATGTQIKVREIHSTDSGCAS